MNTSGRLFRGSTLRLTSLIVNIGVGFYILPFLVHELGDETYGIWVMVGSVFGFYGLLDMGLGIALHRSLIRAIHGGDEAESLTVYSNATILFLLIGAVSLVITVMIMLAAPHFSDSEFYTSLFQSLVLILGIKTAVLFPLWRSYGVLVARYRYDILSVTKIVILLIRTFTIVIFVSRGSGIVTVAIIVSLGEALECLIIRSYAKQLEPGLRLLLSSVDFSRIKKDFNYGKYVFLVTAADKIRFSIDNFVVAGLVGIASVTHYTVAITLIHYFNQIIESIFGVISPLFNEYHKKEEWENLKETFIVSIELTTMSAILIGGGLIVLGQQFISLWMGDGYSDSYTVLLVLGASIVVANSQAPGVTALFAIAKHKYYAKIISIEAVVNLLISIVLARYIGIVGVAIGTAVPLLFNKLVIQPVYVCNQLGLSTVAYYRALFKLFAAGLVFFSLVAIIISQLSIDSYSRLFAASMLVAIIYALVFVRVFMSDNTLRHIYGMLPSYLHSSFRVVAGKFPIHV